MKRSLTLFLKALIVLIAVGALAVCIFWLPGAAARDAATNPETSYLQYPFLLSAYLLVLLFLVALYQAFKLLDHVDHDEAFSASSVKALTTIKKCALAFGGLMVLGTIFVIVFLEGDRAGAVALGLYSTVASGAVAALAALLQRLVQKATEMKSEHDLTV